MNTKIREKLKIAIVTNNYTPYSGGVVSSINSFATEMQKNGHKVFIITLDFLGEYHKDPYYVIRIPSATRFMYKQNHMAVPMSPTKKLEKIITNLKPDIIHTQHPFFLGKSALKISNKLKIPIVFTYHTMYERYAHYLPMPQILTRPIIKKIATSFCKKVDGVIVPSRYIQTILQNKQVTTTIEKIPSGILPIFIKPKVDRLNPVRFKLLTVSRFAKEKNVSLLLDVFSKMHALNPSIFRFTLAGYGQEFENLKHYAYKRLRLGKELIHFIHNPPKMKIADLYSQSDLFIYSSTSDTQGLVMAEAMSCGCPVVAIDGPGQRDIIQNGENGFLVESDKQMVEKIIAVQKDKNLLKKLENGALQTGRTYCPENTTNKLLDFYKKIIEKKYRKTTT